MGNPDEQLIHDARQGNESAFLRLLEEHHRPLFRFAWRLTGSMVDAEDIVQECFLALLRPDFSFDPARITIRTYLFGVVRNQSLKRLRRKEQAAAPEPADRRTPETEALRDEIAESVARAIAELPETQREVLLLSHYEQLPLAEIAKITQLEVTAVKSRLQRARTTLRQTLAAYAPRMDRTI
jgi:RNA polymerase sigma-70 factor (ECF subfamily)